MLKKRLLTLCSSILLLSSAIAQDESATDALTEEQQFDAFLDSLGWQTEGAGELNKWATIEIPYGYRYLNGEDASKLMQAYGNPPSEYEGMIATDDLDWLVLFQFEDTGYVEDDEGDELDADALLKTLTAQQEAGNQYRLQNGMEPMYLDGWAVEPRYNQLTNNLEWGLLLRSGDNPTQFVNYKTKLLGREGVMNVTLVCDLDQLQPILPTYQDVLLGHQYKEGRSYAEYVQGDRLAEYGLTALIAGGAAYGAAKLGLLGGLMAFGKKFFKIIIAGAIALGVAVKKFFGKLAGRDIKETN